MVCFKSFVATILWYTCVFTHIFIYIYIYKFLNAYIYIYNSLASGENHWNIRKGSTFGSKTCSSDEWIRVTPFFKKWKNNRTPDLILDWCRASYMSCVSNIYISCCFVVSGCKSLKEAMYLPWVKVEIETWSSSIQLAVVSEPWWSLLSPNLMSYD